MISSNIKLDQKFMFKMYKGLHYWVAKIEGF